MNKRRIFAVLLILIGIGTIGTVTYINVAQDRLPTFSQNTMLTALWENYKVDDIEASSGRTLDKSQNNLTTSEAESYTLLRAVYEDDHTTFDQSLAFTNNNLRHKNDPLFAWQFGKLPNGSYGILTSEGGNNTASDGDSDIALALIFASQRWQEQKYLTQAKQIVNAIWTQEVATVNGQPLLVANNLEKAKTGDETMIVNPSYFSPASYRIFAKIDATHDWNGLATSSYNWLDQIRTSTVLGANDGLPPDWIGVTAGTGAIVAPPAGLSTQFGYDAMRVPFRIALDIAWNNNARAKQEMGYFGFLKGQWEKNGAIYATYNRDGSVPTGASYQAPAIYGGTLGYFKYSDQVDYVAIYNAKLKALYNPDTQAWRNKLSYYDDTWAWFGLALHENFLTNLSLQ